MCRALEPNLALFHAAALKPVVESGELDYFLSMTLPNPPTTKRLLSPAMLASRAECVAYADIQNDVSLAVWQNEADVVPTQNPHLHTLSLYLAGGRNTYRADMKNRLGGPGKLCFFPAGHYSEWVVGKPLRLLHLYFTDTHLNYLGLTAFDIDPRLLQLQDLTFESDPQLIAGLQRLLANMCPTEMSNRLLLQDIQQQLILYLVGHYSERKPEIIRGGLSPKVKSRVMDYMQANLDQDISLEQLADEACLSTYHFAHMFKQSTGLSPYQFLLKQRMSLAAAELRQSVPIGQVGEHCGFANPSRFARAFRGEFGLAPKVYQQSVGHLRA